MNDTEKRKHIIQGFQLAIDFLTEAAAVGSGHSRYSGIGTRAAIADLEVGLRLLKKKAEQTAEALNGRR